MITLRPLKSEEFPAYAAYFIPDYAAEIASNYGIPLDVALTQAEQTFEKEFPQGADTPGQMLMAILLADHHIGYLAIAITQETASAFINDFFILPPNQGQGHGTAAIAALTALLKPKGITQLRLRVAAKNAAAHRLYTKLGFFPTGTNLAKTL